MTTTTQKIAERLRQDLRDAGLDITWRDNLEPAPDDVVDVYFLDAGLREVVEALEFIGTRTDKDFCDDPTLAEHCAESASFALTVLKGGKE